MKEKKCIGIIMSMLLAFSLAATGCSSSNNAESDIIASVENEYGNGSTDKTQNGDSNSGIGSYLPNGAITQTEVSFGNDAADYELAEVSYKKKDLNTEASETAVKIELNGSSAAVTGEGVAVTGNVVTISAAGDYIVTGTLSNGQIVVDAGDKDDVHIILNGVNIHSEDSSCIYVKNCDKCIITLADGTVNTLSDGAQYIYANEEKEEPNAVIFASDDLTFNGNGKLIIKSGINHAVRCKDKLVIVSGEYEIEAANDGIKAKDAVIIKSGVFNITAGGDGIQASGDDEDETKGYIVIEDGTFTIKSASDGIQAETDLQILGGTFDIITGGGSANAAQHSSDFGGMRGGAWGSMWNGSQKGSASDGSSAAGTDSAGSDGSASTKSIKAGKSVYLSDASIIIDSADDAIHSDNTVVVASGAYDITAGDDGIHADSMLVINGGDINISKSYEGLEALSITINGGDISVTASDDGLNAAGGADGSAVGEFGGFGGRGGNAGGAFAATEGAELVINGGNLYVNSAGDGLDSNGSLYVNGGNVMVDGPTDSGNGALDHNGDAQITGGTLVASGSSGMIENFESTSSQNVILVYFSSTVSAGAEVVVKDSKGNSVLSYITAKQSQCAVMSCAEFKQGETYTVYVNNSENASITCSAVISSNGSTGMGGFGGNRGGMGDFGGNKGNAGSFGAGRGNGGVGAQ